MSAAVKICGITTAEAAGAAADAGAIYGGLVFHENSPRNLSLEQARALAGVMRGRLQIVALITDMEDGRIEAVMRAVRPDLLQLHGSETVARTAQIRSRFSIPVIKVVPVAEASDLATADEYTKVADFLMFDAKAPKGAGRPGGHGAAFDWKLLAGRKFEKPWFLAGGLDADNVARAIALSGAKIVDVSSGVESGPGVKDPARIRAFLNAVRHPAPLSQQSA